MPAAKPLPADFAERPWSGFAAAIPEKLEAEAAAMPPAKVTRHDAIAALEALTVKMARAFDTLTPERRPGRRHQPARQYDQPVLGRDWAVTHVQRHGLQLDSAGA